MAVTVKAGAQFTFYPAVVLFDRPSLPDYDVAPDGRFLMLPIAPQGVPSTPTSIVVVQNWAEELKRLMPGPRGH